MMRMFVLLCFVFVMGGCVPDTPLVGGAAGRLTLAVEFPQAFKTHLIKPETRVIKAVVYGEKLPFSQPLISPDITPANPRVSLVTPQGQQTVLAAAYDENNRILTAGKARVKVETITRAEIDLVENFQFHLSSEELELLKKLKSEKEPLPRDSARPESVSSNFPSTPAIEIKPEVVQPVKSNQDLPLNDIRSILGQPEVLPVQSGIRNIQTRSTQQGLVLSWEDPLSANMTGYHVYLNGQRQNDKVIGIKSTFQYIFKALTIGQEYRLGVSAVHASGELERKEIVLKPSGLQFLKPVKKQSVSIGSEVALQVELTNHHLMGIASIEFQPTGLLKQADGSSYLVALDTAQRHVQNARFQMKWDTSNNSLGEYPIKAIARDLNGQIVIESQPVIIELFSSSGTVPVPLATPTPPSTSAPSIVTVSPSNASNLVPTPITITGTNFQSGATVKVGAVSALGVNVVNATTIKAAVPAHMVKANYTVTVTNPDSQTATLASSMNVHINPFFDFNGDGMVDTLVGAQTRNAGGGGSQGEAYIFLGPVSTSGAAAASVTLTGAVGGDEFGYSVAYAGDVNGDGYGDVIVGAPKALTQKGQAYVFFGSATPPTNIGAGAADVVLTGVNFGSDEFGFDVDTAGDVNRDGLADIIIGAQEESKAYLFYGPPSTGLSTSADVTFTGVNGTDDFGYRVSSVGDFNKDGFSDVMVGAPIINAGSGANQGQAYLFLGGAVLPANIGAGAANMTVTGEGGNNYLGYAVSEVGDFNGDGFSDAVIGAWGWNNTSTGRSYIIFGSATPPPAVAAVASDVIYTGITGGDIYSRSVAHAGDFNGDGFSDMVTGAHGLGGNQGNGYIFLGSASPPSPLSASAADTIFTGEVGTGRFGISISSPGDFNGDGFTDVIIGADDGGPGTEGRAYIFNGSATPPATVAAGVANATLTGITTGDDFGYSVN